MMQSLMPALEGTYSGNGPTSRDDASKPHRPAVNRRDADARIDVDHNGHEKVDIYCR